jgi:hypothetical protein
VETAEEGGEWAFRRFAAGQAAAYREAGNDDFYQKTFASAGVRLALRTDAEALSFDYRFERGSSRAFGFFDVYVDGRPVSFKLAKSKEILAVLVDKQGFGVSRPELCAAIWEDQLYDRRMQKHLDVYIRSLRDTLRKYGAQAILQMERGILRVDPNSFDCDVYRFYSGDSEAVNAYHGEYMSAYSWASMTEGILFWTTKNKT